MAVWKNTNRKDLVGKITTEKVWIGKIQQRKGGLENTIKKGWQFCFSQISFQPNLYSIGLFSPGLRVISYVI